MLLYFLQQYMELPDTIAEKLPLDSEEAKVEEVVVQNGVVQNGYVQNGLQNRVESCVESCGIPQVDKNCLNLCCDLFFVR